MNIKKGSYCVIGLGRFGEEVALQLHKMGKSVVILDKNHEVIQRASKIYDLAIECDTTDINSLIESGINNVTTVIVAVSEVEASIMTCANLRELGQKDIIAKAANNVHKRVLRTMGISRVIIPEIEMADRIAFQALFNVGVDVMGIGGGYSWIKTTVNNEAILNKTLEVLNFRAKYNATIMMIQRQGEVIFPPKNDSTFQIGDVITFVCHDDKVASMIKLFVKEADNNSTYVEHTHEDVIKTRKVKI